MKKVLLILILLLVCNVYAIEQNLSSYDLDKADSIYNPTLDIISLKYEPYPAEPGSYITLWLRVQNLGNDEVDNVKIELIEDFPFSIDEDNIQTLGTIPSYQEAVIKFEKIRIAENAVEGETTLKIRLSPGALYSSTIIKKYPLLFKVFYQF